MIGKNMKEAIAAAVIVAVVVINQCSAQNWEQRATLYSGRDGSGQFLTKKEESKNLAGENFDNRANSACVTGAWLFYDNIEFNKNNGAMEYVFGPDNYCINFNNLGGRVSSVRFAGFPRNYSANTLTLYRDDYFQGTDEYTYVDLPNLALDRDASSLILTGKSAWTLYAMPNYQGDKICVYPPDQKNTPAFVYDTTTINIPRRSIRSVKLGCQGKRKVVAKAFEPNVRTSFNAAKSSTIHGFNSV